MEKHIFNILLSLLLLFSVRSKPIIATGLEPATHGSEDASTVWLPQLLGTCRVEFDSQSSRWSDTVGEISEFSLESDIEEVSRNDFDTWQWFDASWSWWTIAEIVCAGVGIVGNVLVVLVLLRGRNARRSTDVLIGALATADALSSFLILPWPEASFVPDTWLGVVYCKLMFGSVCKWTAITASSYILVAISLDRYIALVFPFQFSRWVTRMRVNVCIVLIWTLILFIALCESGFIIYYDASSHACVYSYLSPETQLAYGVYVFGYRFVFPAVTMLVSQSLIAGTLYRQSKRFSDEASSSGARPSSSHLAARDRILKMMSIVVVVYVICWGPNQIFFFGLNLGLISFAHFDTPLHRLLTLLAFCNPCVNPFIYTARHSAFRVALRDLFKRGRVEKKSLFSFTEQTIKSKYTESSVQA
ncbi:allatostatin-A receptor-like [Diadema antillarum]|uniref:allatostatin-A receptor-like n=1 Tax=Diadema antillarum TaxID=105358 RepID=UPI003A83F838